MSEPTHERLKRYDRWVVGALWVAVAIGLLAFLTDVASAQATPTPTVNASDVAPYYADATATPDNSTLANRSDPTLENVSFWAVQSGGWIFGTGSLAPGGVGLAGPLLIGVTAGGALLGPIGAERVGPVAGGVLAMSVLFGLGAATITPAWVPAMGLFLLGLLVTVVVLRTLR